jgi:hypothetical protein
LAEIGLNYPGFPLRLYCLRLSEKVVVLFNGGIKSAQTAQDSKDLRMKFFEAQTFAKRILEAISANEIYIKDSQILDFQGNESIYLY